MSALSAPDIPATDPFAAQAPGQFVGIWERHRCGRCGGCEPMSGQHSLSSSFCRATLPLRCGDRRNERRSHCFLPQASQERPFARFFKRREPPTLQNSPPLRDSKSSPRAWPLCKPTWLVARAQEYLPSPDMRLKPVRGRSPDNLESRKMHSPLPQSRDPEEESGFSACCSR